MDKAYRIRAARRLPLFVLLLGWTGSVRAQTQAEWPKSKKRATVIGRCIDGTTGKPLAGCRVMVDSWGRRRDRDISERLRRPPPVTTKSDGRFSIRIVARRFYHVGLDISYAGRWPRTGRWTHLEPDEIANVGDVVLNPGVYAVGKVVDSRGKPMQGISVQIDNLPLYIGVEKAVGDNRQEPGRPATRNLSNAA